MGVRNELNVLAGHLSRLPVSGRFSDRSLDLAERFQYLEQDDDDAEWSSIALALLAEWRTLLPTRYHVELQRARSLTDHVSWPGVRSNVVKVLGRSSQIAGAPGSGGPVGTDDPGFIDPDGVWVGTLKPGTKAPIPGRDPGSDDVDGETDDADDGERRDFRAWLIDVSDDGGLRVGARALLGFRVDATSGVNLFEGDTEVAEIPPGGLPTTWLVSSSDADLYLDGEPPPAAAGGASVVSFGVRIPEVGDSELTRVVAVPRRLPARFDTFVMVGASLYRQLSFTLDASLDHARVDEDEALMSLAHAGLGTAHEWTTPPYWLRIIVTTSTNALVSGNTPGGDLESSPFEWSASALEIAGLVTNVRGAAEVLREVHTDYFDDLPADEFAARVATRVDGYRRSQPVAAASAAAGQVLASAEMRGLADAGRQLYLELFPEPIRELLESLPSGSKVSLVWSAGVNLPIVPLGLLHLPHLPDARAPIDPQGFFGLRFRLEQLPKPTSKLRSAALGDPSGVGRAHLLYWGREPSDEVGDEARWQQDQWSSPATNRFLPLATTTNRREEVVQFLVTLNHRPSV